MGAIYQRPSDNVAALPGTTIILTTGTLQAGFALADLVSGNPAQGVLLAAATTFILDFDLGASGAKAVKLAAVGNCNADAGISNFSLTGGATQGASTVSLPFTVPAAPADGQQKYFYSRNDALVTAYRWYRLTCTTTNSLAWFLGQIWLSETIRRFPTTQQFPLDTLQWEEEHGGTVDDTEASVRLASPNYARKQRYRGTVNGTLAEILTIRDWYRESLGFAGRSSLYIPTDQASECDWVVHNQRAIVMSPDKSGIWSTKVELEGLTPGRLLL